MTNCELCHTSLDLKPSNAPNGGQHNDCDAEFNNRVNAGLCVYCGNNPSIGNGNKSCGQCPNEYVRY